jgi:hypothetical protein
MNTLENLWLLLYIEIIIIYSWLTSKKAIVCDPILRNWTNTKHVMLAYKLSVLRAFILLVHAKGTLGENVVYVSW